MSGLMLTFQANPEHLIEGLGEAGATSILEEKVGEKVGENAGKKVGENAGKRLTRNQQQILELLRQHPHMAARELARQVGDFQPKDRAEHRQTEGTATPQAYRPRQRRPLGSTEMTSLGQPERATQNRVIALFRDELDYRYLGDWADRDGNINIEESLLSAWLTKCGYTSAQINSARHKLRTEADNHNRTLYGNNQAVYNLLRYGVPVKTEAGKVTETIHLINWREPERNDFAIAEEVTLKGNHERRPDIVLYVNGIAVGVLELKNSRVSIGHGIRQNLSNQQPEFNAWFFSAVQFIFAGNDSEGLRYGTVGTPEKFFLKWKEDEDDDSRLKLDKYLLKMCRKDRLIELMHDFVLFDGGVKKLPAGAPVFRHQGGAGGGAPEEGRNHLAHSRQRQEHRDGVACEVDSGEQPKRPRCRHH